MRIAVTGGTGFIGSHVVELLRERGHTVSCLILPAERLGWLEGLDVEIHRGSILDPETLPAFLEGCDAIIHLAGLTRAKDEGTFIATNALGARNLVEAALALPAPPCHIVAMSSQASMGPSPADGKPITEDARQCPISAYGRSKVALERTLEAYADRIHSTFIRSPSVYGPRDRDFLEYHKLVRRGLRVVFGRRSVISLVYVKTLAAFLVDCLLEPAAYGQAFFVADEGVYDWDDISGLIEEATGKRTIRIRIPEWAVAVVAHGTALAKPLLRKPPLLTKDKLAEMRQPCWIVSTEKARRLLGFSPLLDTKSAMAETANWYKEKGWV